MDSEYNHAVASHSKSARRNSIGSNIHNSKCPNYDSRSDRHVIKND